MRFLPGHWALGLWKIGVGAVPLLRLPFPNQRPEAVFRRRGAQCAPAGRSGTGPYAETDAFPDTPQGQVSSPARRRQRSSCRGGYQPPESRLPSRDKVPSACEADEGEFRNSKIPSAGRPVSGPYERTGCFCTCRRGGYHHPPAAECSALPISLPPARGKVPSACEADEGGLRNGRTLSTGWPVSGPYERRDGL